MRFAAGEAQLSTWQRYSLKLGARPAEVSIACHVADPKRLIVLPCSSLPHLQALELHGLELQAAAALPPVDAFLDTGEGTLQAAVEAAVVDHWRRTHNTAPNKTAAVEE